LCDVPALWFDPVEPTFAAERSVCDFGHRMASYHVVMDKEHRWRSELAGTLVTVAAAAISTAAMAPRQHEIGLLNEGLIFLFSRS
jgi:hypothetical protein